MAHEAEARSVDNQEDHKSINDGVRAEMKLVLRSRHGTFPDKIRQILRLYQIAYLEKKRN